MQNWKHAWRKFSLKKKIAVMTLCVIILAGGTLMFSMFVMGSALDDVEKNMQKNAIGYNLQEALQEETTHFLLYTRERSSQNREDMYAAFDHTLRCINELPFKYREIGKERYAITWSIRNGYEGYRFYREAVLAMDVSDPTYIDKLYDVFDMQENLSSYALRLVEVTLEQSSEAYEQREVLYKAMPFVLMLIVVTATVLLSMLLKRFTKDFVDPLIDMAEDSRKMADGDFETPELRTDREDEVGELVYAFNKMKMATGDYIHALERLHEEELKNLEKEKRLEGARLDILKNQVNPHFLFNTLNMISCMAKMEEADTTDRMIISLSNLFRYNLRTTEQEVYLDQELEVVDDYIYIQQMRFDNRIQYRKKIEVDERKVRIPSFMLQPIVENAFIHGLSSSEEGGKIELHAWMENDNLRIDIFDNGLGMSKQKLEEIRQQMFEEAASGQGIGIGNISKRIHMLYENGGFEIESRQKEGTVVKITIPQEVVKGEVEHV